MAPKTHSRARKPVVQILDPQQDIKRTTSLTAQTDPSGHPSQIEGDTSPSQAESKFLDPSASFGVDIPVHPINFLEGRETCTVLDLISVPLPSPIHAHKKDIRRSTRGVAKTDIEIPVGEKLEQVVFVPNLPDQFLAPGMGLMKRLRLDLRGSSDDRQLSGKICAASTQRGLAPILYSEKDVETYLRQTVDIPVSLIAQRLLDEGLGTSLDEGGEPLNGHERSLQLPFVSAAPSTYVDPHGVSRAIVLDALHVLKLDFHPHDVNKEEGRTYPLAYVLREDKTPHILPENPELSPLHEFFVTRKDVDMFDNATDDNTLPASRFVPPTSKSAGDRMSIGSKILSTQNWVYNTPFSILSSYYSTIFSYYHKGCLYFSRSYPKGPEAFCTQVCWCLAASGLFKDTFGSAPLLPKVDVTWWTPRMKAYQIAGNVPLARTDKLIARKEAKAFKVKKLKEEDEHVRHAIKGSTVGEEIEKTNDEIAQGRERYDNTTRVLQEEIIRETSSASAASTASSALAVTSACKAP
ncbi:uncharacterized protein STEHIDRAFT_163421 [Stereum hirsutum FP-91666 SS1]|uniref:Uncharacterized protein n=1 Tax=Stereum hirsutum (strain FP-91666) TaxID=721885 RepID=R7RZX4_STEHR|nr:uncharacterized protein STEHIDRAFT_163421 [Stereum hirsutum FP-91666 SS1]EIM79867.1 hypothetical protein STEHIDRAFT_163421 [Stereum hirsutum FP-91666 SS1]